MVIDRPGYSFALQEQMALVRRLRNRGIAEALILEAYQRSPKFGEVIAGMIRDVGDSLADATPIFWSADFPIPRDWPPPPYYLKEPLSRYPAYQGIIVFERPITLRLQDAMRISDHNPQPPVDAIIGSVGWFPFQDAEDGHQHICGVLFSPTTGLHYLKTGIYALCVYDTTVGAEVAAVAIVNEEEYTGEPVKLHSVDNDFQASKNELIQLIDYCVGFMNEELETIPTAANHAARKAAKREHVQPKDVLIVAYRKPAPKPQEPAADGEEPGRHLSVQFPVTGHWRNQRCGPGRKTIRRVWVHEYIKGPEDAPKVHHTTRLLTVIR